MTSSPTAPPGSLQPLVIGYGNPLRRDDGIGWHVAQALATDERAVGMEVISAHQLTPEYAEDIHRARLVVLVDAQVDGCPPPPPGRCAISRIEADLPAETGVSAGSGVWSHHCTPQSLVTMARELYGHAPTVLLVGVGVASTEGGEQLTPPVSRAFPEVVNLILRLAQAPDHCFPTSQEHQHA